MGFLESWKVEVSGVQWWCVNWVAHGNFGRGFREEGGSGVEDGTGC